MENSISNGKENMTWIKKMVVWITLLFMPLSTYATFINGITFGDIALMLGSIIIILYIAKTQIKLNRIITLSLFFYIIFILLHSLIFWIIKPTELETGILGVLRYILYIFWVIISAKEFFNFEYAYKIYKILAIIFGGYCILQFIAFYAFKIFLPINVLGLRTVDYIADIYSPHKAQYLLNGIIMYRPFSVFIEPAYFSAFQAPILYVILNGNIKSEKKKYLNAIFITVSLLMSISTTGMVLLIVCWFKPIIRAIKENYNNIVIIVIIFVIIIIICSFNTNIIRKMLSRVINDDGSAGSSITGRFGTMHILFDGTFRFEQIMFGQGMWTDTAYLPSYGKIIISFGVIGLVYIMFMFLYTYFKANKIGKSMIILILIMCIGTDTLFNITSVLMLTLIYSNIKKSKGIINNDL